MLIGLHACSFFFDNKRHARPPGARRRRVRTMPPGTFTRSYLIEYRYFVYEAGHEAGIGNPAEGSTSRNYLLHDLLYGSTEPEPQGVYRSPFTKGRFRRAFTSSTRLPRRILA